MPVNITPLHTLTHQELVQWELVAVVIVVACDGTTNSVLGIDRRRTAITRDQAGVKLGDGDSDITRFPFASLPAGLQTSLTNFVNNIDARP